MSLLSSSKHVRSGTMTDTYARQMIWIMSHFVEKSESGWRMQRGSGLAAKMEEVAAW